MIKITTIISTFNCVYTFEKAIKTYQFQTYPHKELIVIDGGSEDGTVELINNYLETIDYFVSEPDTGVYDAWNKGVKKATGDWIYFLGADDQLCSPDIFQKVSKILKQVQKRCLVVYGMTNIIGQNGKKVETAGRPWSRTKFLERMTLPHQGVFHNRSLFAKHGFFDERLKLIGDYEFLIRELKSNDPFFMENIIVADMQHGGKSNKPMYRKHFIREWLLIKRKHKISVLTPHFIFFLIRSYIRIAALSMFGTEFSNRLADFYRTCVGKPRIWTNIVNK